MIGIKYLNEAYAVQTEDSGIESSNYVHTNNVVKIIQK